MAVFETIGKKITKTGQKAARKTKNATENIKLSGQIAEAERAISAYCDIIGREYYTKYAAGGWDSDFDEMFIGIKNEKEKIADMKSQLRSMRGMVECPGCGRELADDMNYCSYCGAKLVIPMRESSPELYDKEEQVPEESSASDQ